MKLVEIHDGLYVNPEQVVSVEWRHTYRKEYEGKVIVTTRTKIPGHPIDILYETIEQAKQAAKDIVNKLQGA